MFRRRRQPENTEPAQTRISRRRFLKGAGAVAAAAGAGAVATSCEPRPTGVLPETQVSPGVPPTPIAQQYPDVPYPPAVPPSPGVFRVFTPHEARTVEALTGRILPGTPEDPGAREAGVVIYIDSVLSQAEGFAERTYREPPFAQPYQGEQPPDDGNQVYQVIWVPSEEIERYGYQSILTPREVYRIGLAAVDGYAQEQFGGNFVDLPEDQQDTIVGDLLDNRATGFNQFTSEAFFHVLRRHTAEGMFSDPAYGGNRGMVGWRLIGYPGAQRAYTPQDIATEGTPREPQSLAQLSHLYPGQHTGPSVIMPVRGSQDERHQGQ